MAQPRNALNGPEFLKSAKAASAQGTAAYAAALRYLRAEEGEYPGEYGFVHGVKQLRLALRKFTIAETFARRAEAKAKSQKERSDATRELTGIGLERKRTASVLQGVIKFQRSVTIDNEDATDQEFTVTPHPQSA